MAFEFFVCILFPVSLILLWVHEMDARVGFFPLLVSTLDVLNTRFFSFFLPLLLFVFHIVSFFLLNIFLYLFSCLV